jgi:hypothetical protein
LRDAGGAGACSAPTAAWRDTYATLHLWTQIVGKIRLTKSPWLNHSWHVALYVTARGLTTSPIPDALRTFQIDFDFIDHTLRISTSDGAERQFALAGHSVASFYVAVLAALRDLGIHVTTRSDFPQTKATPPTTRMPWNASSKFSGNATASSSNSVPASSARRAPCISSGAASISR